MSFSSHLATLFANFKPINKITTHSFQIINHPWSKHDDTSFQTLFCAWSFYKSMCYEGPLNSRCNTNSYWISLPQGLPTPEIPDVVRSEDRQIEAAYCRQVEPTLEGVLFVDLIVSASMSMSQYQQSGIYWRLVLSKSQRVCHLALRGKSISSRNASWGNWDLRCTYRMRLSQRQTACECPREVQSRHSTASVLRRFWPPVVCLDTRLTKALMLLTSQVLSFSEEGSIGYTQGEGVVQRQALWGPWDLSLNMAFTTRHANQHLWNSLFLCANANSSSPGQSTDNLWSIYGLYCAIRTSCCDWFLFSVSVWGPPTKL